MYALTDALLRRPNQLVGINRISGIDLAIVVGEHAHGADSLKAGAIVYGDGVVGGVKWGAFIKFEVGLVAGAVAFAAFAVGV